MSSELRHAEEYPLIELVRGVFAGSGSDALTEPEVCAALLDLATRFPPTTSDKDPNTTGHPRVLYLGTATYDLEGPRERQTRLLREAGCKVTSLDVAGAGGASAPTPKALAAAFGSAEIIIVSGGNTLFMVDCWVALGIDELIRDAIWRGVIFGGGSAGLVWLFDGAHSDSADPDTFKASMLAAAAAATAPTATTTVSTDESSSAPPAGATVKPEWEYIRVPGLSVLPGLCVPHHDRVQSNGVPRAADFDNMLRRHPAERGICVDHWCALVLDGHGQYHLLPISSKPGSGPDGKPAVWIKELSQAGGDCISSTLAPAKGSLSELLRPAIGSNIVADPRVPSVRDRNPAPRFDRQDDE
jgi:dipeptidase E